MLVYGGDGGGGVCVCVYVGHGSGRTERRQAYWQVKMGRNRTGGDRTGGGPSRQRNWTTKDMEMRKSRECMRGGQGIGNKLGWSV